MLLPGKKIIPERIQKNRQPYLDALGDADRHWADGHFNVSALQIYLEGLLAEQLAEQNG